MGTKEKVDAGQVVVCGGDFEEGRVMREVGAIFSFVVGGFFFLSFRKKGAKERIKLKVAFTGES